MSITNPIFGTDASNHQLRVNWKKVRSEDFRFAICKASQGDYFRDEWFKANIRESEKAGLVAGAYHYLEHGHIEQQINLFLSMLPGANARAKTEGRLIAVDVEPSGYGNDATVNDVWNFVHGLHERIGPHPIIIYSGYYWRDHLDNPDLTSLVNGKDCVLWDAHYPDNKAGYAWGIYQRAPKNSLRGEAFGGQPADILQFTQSAWIAGKKMDADAFPGSMKDLKALTTAKKDKPAPKPKPAAKIKNYFVRAVVENLSEENARRLARGSRKAGWSVKIGQSGEDKDIEAEIFAALEARLGAYYNAWTARDGWRGAPIWGDRLPSVEQIREHGGVCSTVLNIAAHVAGVEIPGGENFTGGTGNWGQLAREIGEPFTGAGTKLRPLDIVGSHYRGAALRLQGHVCIVRTPGLPKEANVYQSDAFAGNGKPGLNRGRTVAQTNAMLAEPSKWEYIIRRERWLG